MLKAISELVAKLPWSMIILFCLTLGLAPFFPIPRVGKIKNVFFGNPYQAILRSAINQRQYHPQLLISSNSVKGSLKTVKVGGWKWWGRNY